MHYLIPILFCRGIIRYHVFISHPALSLLNIHTFTSMPCVDFMGKVCELYLRYVLLNWLVRGERLKPNYHFFMWWSEGLAKHRLRDNSGYIEHAQQYVLCPRFRWWGNSRLIRTMAGISEASLPRKRAVYSYVREDGVVANCISSALAGSDFRRKCEICGKKFKSNKQAYAHLKIHGGAVIVQK